MPRLDRTSLPVGRPSNQPGMPREKESAQALLVRSLPCRRLLTLCEEAGQVCSQHAAYRGCVVIHAALDVVDDVPLLHVAVPPYEPDRRGSHNRRAHLDLGGDSCRLWQRECIGEAECRAQQESPLGCALVHHLGGGVVVVAGAGDQGALAWSSRRGKLESKRQTKGNTKKCRGLKRGEEADGPGKMARWQDGNSGNTLAAFRTGLDSRFAVKLVVLVAAGTANMMSFCIVAGGRATMRRSPPVTHPYQTLHTATLIRNSAVAG